MPHYNFKKDYKVATATEKQVAKFLEKTQGVKVVDFCDTNEYDVRVRWPSGFTSKIEIKEDFTCKETGNVGLEYECRGKPSGISVSQADYYLYKIHRPDGKVGLYVIPIECLKSLVKAGAYHRTVCGGDAGSNSMNYLFKLSEVEEHFKFLGYV